MYSAGIVSRGKNNKCSAVAETRDRFATVDIGRKVGAAVPLSVGEAGSSSNTMSPGPRPTSVTSGILIHPIFRPQYISVIRQWIVFVTSVH